MNKMWMGAVSAVLLVIVLLWLLGGSRISCRESFWDKDKHVITVTE